MSLAHVKTRCARAVRRSGRRVASETTVSTKLRLCESAVHRITTSSSSHSTGWIDEGR